MGVSRQDPRRLQEGLRDRLGWPWRRGRILADVEAQVRVDAAETLHAAPGPANPHRLRPGGRPQADEQLRIVARHETAAPGDVVHLQDPPRDDLQPGPDGGGVRARPVQPDGESVAIGRAIPVQARRRLELVHDQVGITVAVEISEGRAVTDPGRAEAPGGGDLVETQLARVSEDAVGLFSLWGLLPEVEGHPVPASGRFERGPGVTVREVAGHAVGHVQIESAVLVQIDEPR